MRPAHRRSVILLSVLFLLGACSTHQPAKSEIATNNRRIVSLMPSLTEDLFAIGAGSQVVGVDQIANYPAAVKRLPKIASFSTIDNERILRLHADLIIGIPAQERLTQPLRNLGLATVFLKDDSFDDIFRDLDALGHLSGHGDAARSLIKNLRSQTADLQLRVHFKRPVRCFVVLATSPIITVGRGSYIARLIELAGGRNASNGLRQPYGAYSAEALLDSQPDIIISESQTHLQDVFMREPWRSLHAVQHKQVFFIDPPDILFRPGPRYNEGLSWLIARFKQIAG